MGRAVGVARVKLSQFLFRRSLHLGAGNAQRLGQSVSLYLFSTRGSCTLILALP